MRPETLLAIKKLRAGRPGLTDEELRAFFIDVRAESDEKLLARPTAKRPSKPSPPPDPLVAMVKVAMSQVEAGAKDKAQKLLEFAERNGGPKLGSAPSFPGAIKKLRAHFADAEIAQLAHQLVVELRRGRTEQEVD